MTTSSVPRSCSCGLTRKQTVADWLGLRVSGKGFLPSMQWSSFGATPPRILANAGKLALRTSMDLQVIGMDAALMVTDKRKKPSCWSRAPWDPRFRLSGTSSTQMSMVGREAT